METDAASDPRRTASETTPGLDRDFDRAATRYDLLTRLNPGYHRHLAAAAHELAARLDGPTEPVLLDLGCGSGSSTAALLGALPNAAVTAVDASSGMLDRARAKTWPASVRFVHAKAEHLPDLGLAPADGVLAAYLFRNIPAEGRDHVLGLVREQLRPGGWLVVQDYSVAGRPLRALAWTLVCWAIVIPLAVLLRGSPRLYVYLWRSVLAFDSTDRFAGRLAGAGFTDVARLDVRGWQRGILHTFVARRPLEA
jgi:ubiquinone/menaquinone biosynthesis C-methylase UbiE